MCLQKVKPCKKIHAWAGDCIPARREIRWMLAKPRWLADITNKNLPRWIFGDREHYGRRQLLSRHGWAWPGIAGVADDGLERRPLNCEAPVTVGCISSNLAIICILRWRARSRPLTRRCRAAIQRMWSSKINRALNRERGGGRDAAAAPPAIDVGRRTLTCKQRLSSLSPLTSTSCHTDNVTHSRVANWHFKMPNNSNLAFLKGVWQWKFGFGSLSQRHTHFQILPHWQGHALHSVKKTGHKPLLFGKMWCQYQRWKQYFRFLLLRPCELTHKHWSTVLQELKLCKPKITANLMI